MTNVSKLLSGVAMVVGLGVASEARAAGDFLDGGMVQNQSICPATGQSFFSTSTQVGYYVDTTTNTPHTGEVTYIHAVAWNTSPCNSDGPGFDFFLPAGATFAVDAQHPVYCFRGTGSNNYEVVPNVAGQSSCLQTAQTGNFGGSFFGWSKLPSGWFLEMQVPVTFARRLVGSNATPVTVKTSSAWGTLTATVAPIVAYQPGFRNFSVGNTQQSAFTNTTTVGFALDSFFEGGTLFVDYGTTQALGSSAGMVSVPAGSQTFPNVTASMTTAWGTTFFWRVRLVTAFGTFTGPMQSFTTPYQLQPIGGPVACRRLPC
jgi:hypothetical protein